MNAFLKSSTKVSTRLSLLFDASAAAAKAAKSPAWDSTVGNTWRSGKTTAALTPLHPVQTKHKCHIASCAAPVHPPFMVTGKLLW